MNRTFGGLVAFALVAAIGLPSALSQGPEEPPDFKPYDEVTKGYEKIVSADDSPGMYTLWIRKKDNQMLAELPRDFASKKYFFALTVASGEEYAGLQAGDLYAYWRRYDKHLALIQPNIGTRSTGDQESKDSVNRLFTDTVLLDIPIVTIKQPEGSPVIDLDALLVGQSSKFFGEHVTNPNLASVKTAKAFPNNVEVAFEAPVGGGVLKTLHYSISEISDNPSYQPRVADERVGYFTTSYNDLGKFSDDETTVRYVNRWQLEKRDPSLKLSPPKRPIIFYIEHTTPVRYRPWVKKGILYWNAAFEKVGIRDAIEVYQQDAVTKEHIDKDPEDVRYNFIRWLNNDISTAIGPSRVNPMTGQILDADIVLTDGWIRYYLNEHRNLLPEVAMEGFSPETLAWLDEHPNWDPRILFAPASERPRMLAERRSRGPQAFGGHPLAQVNSKMLGDDEFDGLVGRTSQVNGMCLCSQGKAFDLALMRMHFEIMADELIGEGAPPAEDGENVLDGIPERFVGPLLADLTAHEVGHTLGLRHNFKASSIYSLADINSDKVKGKPFAGSVMDYLPTNIHTDQGPVQGDYAMVSIGPYDMWAIEYGYTFESDLKPILSRVAEPELQYATDEDTVGADPLARRYDFSSNPLDYAKSNMWLAKHHRERLLEKLVKDGESWSKARRGYEMSLQLQMQSLSMMSNWVGGAYIHRDKKGDKDGRAPLEVVSATAQREALTWTIDNSFSDESFGLTPDVLRHLGADQWLDGGFGSVNTDYPIHDRIMAIQASVLTNLMNPSTLRQVYDNEVRVPADQDAVTLPELLDTVSNAIWTDLDKPLAESPTARKPWISSLRRNLQREHLERLIDLTMASAGSTAAYKPISNLAVLKLRSIQERITKCLENKDRLDPYSLAHLAEAQVRIGKALDAQYIYNVGDLGGGGVPFHMFLEQNERREQK